MRLGQIACHPVPRRLLWHSLLLGDTMTEPQLPGFPCWVSPVEFVLRKKAFTSLPPPSPLPHMLGSPCISGRGTLSSGVARTRAHSGPPACPPAHLPARERPPGVNNHLSVFLLTGFSLSSRLIHPQALTRGLNTQSIFGRPCGDFWSLLPVTPPGLRHSSAQGLPWSPS